MMITIIIVFLISYLQNSSVNHRKLLGKKNEMAWCMKHVVRGGQKNATNR